MSEELCFELDSDGSYIPFSEACKALTDMHNPGAKDDSLKPDMDLVLSKFSRSLQEISKVGTFGAKKYSEDGWLDVPNGVRRYQSALLRHYFKHSEGELVDKETNYLHLAHAAWNSLAVLELYLKELDIEAEVEAPIIKEEPVCIGPSSPSPR